MTILLISDGSGMYSGLFLYLTGRYCRSSSSSFCFLESVRPEERDKLVHADVDPPLRPAVLRHFIDLALHDVLGLVPAHPDELVGVLALPHAERPHGLEVLNPAGSRLRPPRKVVEQPLNAVVLALPSLDFHVAVEPAPLHTSIGRRLF